MQRSPERQSFLPWPMLLANAAVGALLVGLLAPAAQMPMPATLTLRVLVVLLVAPGLPQVAAAVAGTMAALIVDVLAGQDWPYVGQTWVAGGALRMLAFGLLALIVSTLATRTTSRLSARATSPDWTTTLSRSP
jgi:hypothetical protein